MRGSDEPWRSTAAATLQRSTIDRRHRRSRARARGRAGSELPESIGAEAPDVAMTCGCGRCTYLSDGIEMATSARIAPGALMSTAMLRSGPPRRRLRQAAFPSSVILAYEGASGIGRPQGSRAGNDVARDRASRLPGPRRALRARSRLTIGRSRITFPSP
jgi:hypothetical protein